MSNETIRFTRSGQAMAYGWSVPESQVAYDNKGAREILNNLSLPVFVVNNGGRLGLANAGVVQGGQAGSEVVAVAPPLPVERLGDPDFGLAHGTAYPYYAGAMANGIASVDMITTLGKAGLLGSFGAGGLLPSTVEEAIMAIRKALPNGPYMFNLIHSPSEPVIEQGVVDLYLHHGVRCVEAAAYMGLTPQVVQYRVAGLAQDPQGNIVASNRIVAKISRREVATRFMEPAPERILAKLVEAGKISQDQANMARQIPMADDVTVEADSGGHTDNRALVSVLPSTLELRDHIQEQYRYATPIRVGAGGGIGTPQAALAAFAMGAQYIVTGSVNQSCVESGASVHTKNLLAQADMADTIMAPAADMFEMGVKVQVLKRGSLFAVRASKLHETYCSYDSIDNIPSFEREKLEKQIFKKSLDEIWQDTIDYFFRRDPALIEKAEADPKKKMALIFRWYLGLSSRWANVGEPGREMDYQIWCGSCMGAFNAWVKGTYLEAPENRSVTDVARHILCGTAFLSRINTLRTLGVAMPTPLAVYRPESQAL